MSEDDYHKGKQGRCWGGSVNADDHAAGRKAAGYAEEYGSPGDASRSFYSYYTPPSPPTYSYPGYPCSDESFFQNLWGKVCSVFSGIKWMFSTAWKVLTSPVRLGMAVYSWHKNKKAVFQYSVHNYIKHPTHYIPTKAQVVDWADVSPIQWDRLEKDPIFSGKEIYMMTACSLQLTRRVLPVRAMFSVVGAFKFGHKGKVWRALNCGPQFLARERQFFVTENQLDKLSIAPPTRNIQRGDGSSGISPYNFQAGILTEETGSNVVRMKTLKERNIDSKMRDFLDLSLSLGRVKAETKKHCMALKL